MIACLRYKKVLLDHCFYIIQNTFHEVSFACKDVCHRKSSLNVGISALNCRMAALDERGRGGEKGNNCQLIIMQILSANCGTNFIYFFYILVTALYKIIRRPVVLYGSEAWCLTANDEKNLRIWERKALRKIFGPICVAGYWRSRTNEEVRQFFGELDIVTEI